MPFENQQSNPERQAPQQEAPKTREYYEQRISQLEQQNQQLQELVQQALEKNNRRGRRERGEAFRNKIERAVSPLRERLENIKANRERVRARFESGRRQNRQETVRVIREIIILRRGRNGRIEKQVFRQEVPYSRGADRFDRSRRPQMRPSSLDFNTPNVPRGTRRSEPRLKAAEPRRGMEQQRQAQMPIPAEQIAQAPQQAPAAQPAQAPQQAQVVEPINQQPQVAPAAPAEQPQVPPETQVTQPAQAPAEQTPAAKPAEQKQANEGSENKTELEQEAADLLANPTVEKLNDFMKKSFYNLEKRFMERTGQPSPLGGGTKKEMYTFMTREFNNKVKIENRGGELVLISPEEPKGIDFKKFIDAQNTNDPETFKQACKHMARVARWAEGQGFISRQKDDQN